MSFSLDEARAYLLNQLPPDADKLYDLEPGGDPYLLMDAAAELFKTRAFALVEELRREIIPGGWITKLPDWERFLGLSNTLVALFGSDQARQLGIKAKLRESGPFSDAVVASVISPLFGYFSTTPVEILKCSRSALNLYHTYGGNTLNVPDSTTGTDAIRIVADGGKVSKAGARLIIEYNSGTGPFAVTLTAPDGTTQTWNLDITTESLSHLYGLNFIGAPCYGNWQLALNNTSGGTYNINWYVRVDGIGPSRHDTGGAIWWWGVYADPAHLGENGSPPDFASVLRAIERIKHSHGVGRLIRSKAMYPNELSGLHCAIPNQFIPT